MELATAASSGSAAQPVPVSIFLSKEIRPPFAAGYPTLGIVFVFVYAPFRAKVP